MTNRNKILAADLAIVAIVGELLRRETQPKQPGDGRKAARMESFEDFIERMLPPCDDPTCEACADRKAQAAPAKPKAAEPPPEAKPKTSLTLGDLDALIVKEQYHVFPGSVMTVCCLTLKNGFKVIGESAPVDPANFNENMGRAYARENAREKLWMLEGYRLKQLLADQTPAATGA